MSPFTLRLGALSPDLDRQLHEQGIELDAEDVERWELDAKDVSRLSVRGVLTSAEAERARRRIFKQVQRAAAATGGGS